MESRIVCEEEVIGLANSDTNGFIKVDDFVLVCEVWVCTKFPCHVLLVIIEFLHSIGVHKEDSSCVLDVHDHPFPIDVNLFGRFAATTSVKADVEVAEGLCVFVIRCEGIVAGENFVKVNIAVEENVIPLSFWEDWIPWDCEDRDF